MKLISEILCERNRHTQFLQVNVRRYGSRGSSSSFLGKPVMTTGGTKRKQQR